MQVGDSIQTKNGLLIAKVRGWYCPVCAGSYGEFFRPILATRKARPIQVKDSESFAASSAAMNELEDAQSEISNLRHELNCLRTSLRDEMVRHREMQRQYLQKKHESKLK